MTIGAGDAVRGRGGTAGAPHDFSGRVIRGRRLGRRLGVPTANLAAGACDARLWGSWAALAVARGRRYRAIAHVGVRPSVEGGGEPLVEAHLFGFTGTLYGEALAVRLLHKVSDETAVASFEALARKVQDDVGRVRRFFADDGAAGERGG